MFYAVNSVRTNNFSDEHMADKIGMLWQNTHVKLSQVKGCVYGVYNQYQTDYQGDFTLSIAVDHPIEDFTSTIVPNVVDKYCIFDVDNKDQVF